MDDSSLLNIAASVINVDTDQINSLAPGQVPAVIAPTAADTGTAIPPEMANLYATIVNQIENQGRI
jgi:hypothetical protein